MVKNVPNQYFYNVCKISQIIYNYGGMKYDHEPIAFMLKLISYVQFPIFNYNAGEL